MSIRDDVALPVVVIGASGKTGRLVIEKLLEDGHRVRAISRSAPEGLSCGDPDQLQFVKGDVAADDPAPWMVDADAVVFTAAGDASTENAVDHLGARRCAEAAHSAGVVRFFLVSAHGAHDPMSWGAEFQSYLEAKAAGEGVVRAVFPESTVLRPGILTDEPETGKATIRTFNRPGERPVARAVVASVISFFATAAEGKAITLEIVGGDLSIDDTLELTF